MKNIFIINAHEAYPFSEGKLNATLVENAKTNLTQKDYDIKQYLGLLYVPCCSPLSVGECHNI